jgi:CheY-like chemotaxis protein
MKTTKKILIVDDDIDVITVIKAILTKEGYEVISAGNKEEGIAMMKAEKPDLAILDVMMTTHYEGFELAKELLDNPEFKETPILIQTSIDVFVTTRADVQSMALEYRKDPNCKDMQVLLVRNAMTGDAGIDYRTEDGKNVWFPVSGFVRKPIEAKVLVPTVNSILG